MYGMEDYERGERAEAVLAAGRPSNEDGNLPNEQTQRLALVCLRTPHLIIPITNDQSSLSIAEKEDVLRGTTLGLSIDWEQA